MPDILDICTEDTAMNSHGSFPREAYILSKRVWSFNEQINMCQVGIPATEKNKAGLRENSCYFIQGHQRKFFF